jgi:hypothetical protein
LRGQGLSGRRSRGRGRGSNINSRRGRRRRRRSNINSRRRGKVPASPSSNGLVSRLVF